MGLEVSEVGAPRETAPAHGGLYARRLKADAWIAVAGANPLIVLVASARSAQTRPMTIETLSTREVYRNRWMTVREDSIRRQDGTHGLYGVVDKPDFALVIPYENGAFHLVEQYRHPVKGRFLEFPQGMWEDRTDASPESVAAGELQEETGLVAGRMKSLGHVFNAPGYSTQGMHVFLAEELTAGPQRLSPEESDLVVTRVTVERFEALVREGRIKDGSSLAAYGLLRLHRRLP